MFIWETNTMKRTCCITRAYSSNFNKSGMISLWLFLLAEVMSSWKSDP